jgi:hypothetical protein
MRVKHNNGRYYVLPVFPRYDGVNVIQLLLMLMPGRGGAASFPASFLQEKRNVQQ